MFIGGQYFLEGIREGTLFTEDVLHWYLIMTTRGPLVIDFFFSLVVTGWVMLVT